MDYKQTSPQAHLLNIFSKILQLEYPFVAEQVRYRYIFGRGSPDKSLASLSKIYKGHWKNYQVYFPDGSILGYFSNKGWVSFIEIITSD